MPQVKYLDHLITALTATTSKEDCLALLEDLCTIKELMDMAQRFEAAISLDEGKNYNDITSTIGLSTATISRVNRCLKYGDGGYRKAIDLLKETEKNNANQ